MPFRISPGVSVTEKDFTNIVPAISTTKAGYAGNFQWGPIEQRVLVANENELASLFGTPNDYNHKGWLCAANFLGYGGALTVVRATSNTAANSCFGDGCTADVLIKNAETHAAGQASNTNLYSSAPTNAAFVAKYAGTLGGSLKVAIVNGDGSSGTSQGVSSKGSPFTVYSGFGAAAGGTTLGISGGAAGITACIVGDDLTFAGFSKTFKVTAVSHGGTMSTVTFTPAATSAITGGVTGYWQFAYSSYAAKPTTSSNLSFVGGAGDQFNVIVIDEDGLFAGVTNGVLEVFQNVSKAIDAKDGDGNSNYYVDVINARSKYLWAGGTAISTAGNSAAGTTFGNTAKTYGVAVRAYYSATGGSYADASTDSQLLTGFNLFADPDTVDVSLLISGNASASLAGEIVDIVDARKDCVAFISPEYDDVVGVTSVSTQTDNVVDFKDNQLNKSSSYAVLDSGWKYQYDRYNDKLRWVPLNGDIAGLCARTDRTNDPWFSPAGFNRGQIRGVVKLAFNPTAEAYRDELYKDGINPVVAFPGEGTVLFGDKTLQSKGSAFDRINVRRLFIVMEKAIATAAKFQLFEQNDSFTRAQFKNLIEPFLRDIQGRRGLADFKVVCDESNNTAEVIDNNRFVADIFVKPTRSINFIQLNFVATRSGVDFNEVAGG